MNFQVISETKDVSGSIKKIYHAIENGRIVGRIVATIRTHAGLNFSISPDGYAVSVHVFHKNVQISNFSSSTLENKTMKEAKLTRSGFIKLAKKSMKSCEESYSL